MSYDGMTCQDCERGFDEVMDFLVADPIWNYVISNGECEQTIQTIRVGLFDERLMARSEGLGGVLCLACFDKRARALRVEYREHVLVFGINCWMGGHYNDGLPLVAPTESGAEVLSTSGGFSAMNTRRSAPENSNTESERG